MPSLTLYGIPASTYVRTARLILTEANIDYQLEGVDIFNGDNKTADYLNKHPFGKVPTLAVDGQFIYESLAISDYLNRGLADERFSPSDPLTRAKMYQIISIVDNYLYDPAIGTLTLQNLMVPSQGGEPDKAAIEGAIAPTQTALGAIEDLFQGSPYLLGSSPSLADFYLIPVFFYLSKTPQFDAATAQTPQLSAWWNTVKELDLVKDICG